MISTLDVIAKINTFDKTIDKRLLFESKPLNPKQGAEAVEFLRELVKQSKGDLITFTDYGQLRQYSQAVQIVDIFNRLPLAEEFKAKGGLTYDGLEKSVKEWQAKEKYITIPAEFVAQAKRTVLPYYAMAERLPKEKKAAAIRIINRFYDPKGLFEEARKNVIGQVGLLLETTKEKHADKGVLVKNIYFDKLTDKQKKSLATFNNWLKVGIDPKYLFSPKTIENSLQKALAGKIENVQARHKLEAAKEAEAAKRNDEFREKSLKQLKEARHDPENLFQEAKYENFRTKLRTALGVNEQAQQNFFTAKTLFDETQNLQVSPETKDLDDLEANAIKSIQDNSAAQAETKSLIDSFSKL